MKNAPSKEHINARGEYTNCFAFYSGSAENTCNALKEWYNAECSGKHCLNCPFYKVKKRAARFAV